MKKFPELLTAWVAALWVGGLWAVGYLAAPTLFYSLPDRMSAGMLAGKMFSHIGWVGMVCGAVLLLLRFSRFGAQALKQGFFWIALLMLLMTVAQHFGIAPIMQQLKDQAGPRDVMESLLRDRFTAWHGVSSVLYLIESLLGLALIAKQHSR